MRVKLLHLTGFLMAISGAILYVSDQLKIISALNPTFAHIWGLIAFAAMALDRFGKLMGWTVPAEQPPIQTVLTKL